MSYETLILYVTHFMFIFKPVLAGQLSLIITLKKTATFIQDTGTV